jgi:3-dehydroquinate synthase
MIKVRVELGKNSYDICIGSGLLPRIGLWLKEKGFSGKAVIITDNMVRPLYAGILERSLTNAGFTTSVIEIPAGEEQKTLATAGRLYQKLAEAFAERSTTVLALGGGVIGDLSGFVAATYMRGVPLIHVPTTLLAMVDSSIGGKTAVDHANLKNMIGAFYQPKLVVADIDTLKSLPRDELSNGMGEVIKHAVIKDRAFFTFLQANMAAAMSLIPGALEDIVEKNVRIKGLVVETDEKESGQRAVLNFGHTVGHAVEAVTDFKIKHGQAVAIGMVAAARISERLGFIHNEEVNQLELLIHAAGLPAMLPVFSREEKEKLLETIRHDKKVRDGKVRLILLKAIGSAFIDDKVDNSIITEVLFGWQPS